MGHRAADLMAAMKGDDFLRGLLDPMSLEEKAGQLNLLTGAMDASGMKTSGDLEAKIRDGHCGAVFNVYTPQATRNLQEIALARPNGIPLIFGYDVIHGHRTIFPIPLGLSCSWNLGLIARCARAAAAEAAADGLHWVFSPMVDISQDARWGRVAEGSGEDPWLGARIATAMVRGYQGEDLADPAAVVACVKHFALYGAALAGREYHSVDMSRREMVETYFPPYRAAIDAGAHTVMTSFNVIDGIPASGNRWLLTEILRDAWGFGGWVVTDYTAVSEMVNHGTAADDADAARHAFAAGVDMDMVSEAFLAALPNAVRSQQISEDQLDAAVLRVLRTKRDLGLFDDPFARCDETHAAATHRCAAHREMAREAARESIVLLQNDGDLLPLRRDAAIAVIGPLADSHRDMLGCWIAAGNPAEAVSALDGVSEFATVAFARGCEVAAENHELLGEAIRVAEAVDIVILVLGETWDMNGEAASRTDIHLPHAQRKLAEAIAATGKPVVLVTLSGRPLELSWEALTFPAILHVWALGCEGGHALAEVIFGAAAPVGKLTMGFPRSVGQLPMSYREKPGGRPFNPDIHYSSKYLDCPNDALFPFGHGLTYGMLELSLPTASPAEMMLDGSVKVSVKIHNTNSHPVTETLQLYLRDPVASVSRPLKELRGYQRVTLEPGERRKLTFEITDTDLAFPGKDFQSVVEPGEFIAMVGTSSAEVQNVSFIRLAAR